MKKYTPLLAIFLLVLSPEAFASGPGGYDQLKSEIQKYTSGLPFTMQEIRLPEFPDTTFNIESYGAVGDGQTMNTVAFRKTVDACSNAGGGTVIVPPGLWLTGPIELKSNVNLHLERGALVLFSRDHDDYPIIKSPTRGFVVASPVYGFNLENVAITGTGLLDGSGITWRPVKKAKVTSSMWKELTRSGGVVTDGGKMWWPSEQAANGAQYIRDLKARKAKKELTAGDFLPAKDFMRPILLLLSKCRNVLVDGVVTFIDMGTNSIRCSSSASTRTTPTRSDTAETAGAARRGGVRRRRDYTAGDGPGRHGGKEVHGPGPEHSVPRSSLP